MPFDYCMARLLALTERRDLRAANADEIAPRLAEAFAAAAVNEPEMAADVSLTRSGLYVDFFFPADDVAVLIDPDGRLAGAGALETYFAAEWLAGIAILTAVSPDLYPTGHSTRELRRNKPLAVIRIAASRPGAAPS